jgi:hypothetical protein
MVREKKKAITSFLYSELFLHSLEIALIIFPLICVIRFFILVVFYREESICIELKYHELNSACQKEQAVHRGRQVKPCHHLVDIAK